MTSPKEPKTTALEKKALAFTKRRLQHDLTHLLAKYANRQARAARKTLLKERKDAWDEFHSTAPPTPEEYRRALRGIVTHVLPRVRTTKLIHLGRRPAPRIKDGLMGACNWCLRPCLWPNRWHRWCRLIYWMTGDGPSGANLYKGIKKMLSWRNILPPTPCVLCNTQDGVMTIDHIQPIANIARTGDQRAYIRAFLPQNLQWLCRTCHNQKTADDHRELNETKRQQGAPVLPPKWGPNAPIQFLGLEKARRHKLANRIKMPD